MRHVVVGTAGHIDHGKSALVLSLTGTDPDRLQEEKARGITIDLGFAHAVENGVTLSFVDVPGHERFVRNMLAGVGGMDLLMLHVAANESVKPQTREHFDICRLLHVPAGVVVLTKSDLADPSTLEVVRLEVEEMVAGSFLDGAPVVAVSARTGDGIAELRRLLAARAAAMPERPVDGPPKLPIDRVFTLRGFGTIVTGTLNTGRLVMGDDLVVEPAGRQAKVRSLQVHGEEQREALAGQRVAVNLSGTEVGDVTRGDTLTVPDAVTISRRIDAQIELLPSARSLKHGGRVRFHHGTRELLGRVVCSTGSEVQPGTATTVRLHLEAPATLTRGDRFILRTYSPASTIGGGVVLDPAPSPRGTRTAVGRKRAGRLANFSADSRDAAMVMIEEADLAGFSVTQMASRLAMYGARSERVIGDLRQTGVAIRIGDLLLSSSSLAAVRQGVLTTLAAHHAEHPAEEGMSREELRRRLFAGSPQAVFAHVLSELDGRGWIRGRDRMALADHVVAFTTEDAVVSDAIVQAVDAAALAPPDCGALARLTGSPPDLINRLTALLARRDLVVRIGELVFASSALARLKEDVRALKTSGESSFDVAAFKKRYGVTRKHAIPLLEYLDDERVTRRVGDTRIVL